MRKNIINIKTLGASLCLIATLMSSSITVSASNGTLEANNVPNYATLGVRQEEPPKLGERGTPPPILGERKEPDKQVIIEEKKDDKQKNDKVVAPKKTTGKSVTTKNPTPKPKPVEKKVEVVEKIVEEVVETPIEEVSEKIFSITTSRYDIGTVDNTPYELLSPIITEANGTRRQYITRAEVSEILYAMLDLEVEPGMGPYQDIESTIYLMPVITTIRHGLMTPVSSTEFGAWDKVTWNELSHIVRKIKSSKGISSKSIMNKSMGIEEIIYSNIGFNGTYPTKTNVVRILEGIMVGR